MAAFIILLFSLTAALTKFIYFRESLEASVEFGTLLLNSLSLLWFALVLAKNERSTDAQFGRAVRREMPAVVLALTISLLYSAVRLVAYAFPAIQLHR
jgi:hypothetical protein